MEIFKLFGSLLINNDEANKSLSKTESKAQKLSTSLVKGAGTAVKFGAGVATGVAAGGAAILGLATNAADATDRIDKMSQKLGLSRDGFQEWEYVMSQAGVEIDSMQTGMKTLSGRMGEALDGAGVGAEAFKTLGVEITDGMSQEDAFNATIEALQGMEDGIRKAEIANDLFGKSGQELLPLLNGTAESTAELKNQAKDLGLVMSDESIDAGVKFTDTLDQLKRSSATMISKLGAEFLPIVQKFAEYIIDHMPQITKGINVTFKVIGKVVSVAITWIKNLITWVQTWVKNNEEKINATREGFSSFFNTLVTMIQSFINLVMVIWNKYGEEIMAVVSAVWNIISTIFSGAFTLITDIFNIFAALFTGDWSALWEGIKTLLVDAFTLIGDLLGGYIEYIQSIWALFGEYLSNIWSGIWDGISDYFKDKVNGIVDVLNWLIEKINGVSFDVPDWVPGIGGETFGMSLSSIPKLASGTNYVAKEGLAYLHEGEAVVPKKYNNSVNQGSTVNFYNSKFFNERDAKKMGQIIVRRQKMAGVNP